MWKGRWGIANRSRVQVDDPMSVLPLSLLTIEKWLLCHAPPLSHAQACARGRQSPKKRTLRRRFRRFYFQKQTPHTASVSTTADRKKTSNEVHSDPAKGPISRQQGADGSEENRKGSDKQK
ncbi:hypothetical protein DPEC_G00005190 [Dallia pectoralis]|uniref:Uncharacterized protein n=1 Tax=Dallia pectoralis TaxID=75939 RepID=A0ACC2HJP1_DALPE|nr:hypothetical protein DPEC_G00005190 [Dallia pectoralis]